ncbi:hypothetical protein WG947_11260 [Pontibacter sp. H259]|uniref:OmpP1/FadL family transporter n=1 Tax=Pontibacter sp. H259 TaxID=3133421 RepID=UPI0030C1B2DD
MYKSLRALVCAAVLCIAFGAQAQNIGNAPYSRFGIGEYNYNTGNIRNAGMANTGVGAASSFQINTANPSLLFYNSTTSFEIGVGGEVKKLKAGSGSQVDGAANLSSVTFSVPLAKFWTTALSLRPYSNVAYDVRYTSNLTANDTVTTRYKGEGGITELYFGHGVKITKGLTIGASGSYLFGRITEESATSIRNAEIDKGLSFQEVAFSEKTKYSDLLFRVGANYRQKLKDKMFMSAGAVYTLKTDLSADRNTSFERRASFGNVIEDSLYTSTSESAVNIPSSFSAGVSIDNGSNLTFAADYVAQQWSGFRNFAGEQELADSYRASIGAEYTPDANSVGNYFERVTYRAGLYYGNTPYIRKGEQIKDKGVTAGFTMPFGRSTIYDMYQLNTALGYGVRGTTDNGLVQENYFKFDIGVTINSRWFIKRRLE